MGVMVAGAAWCLFRIFTSVRMGAAGEAIEIQLTSLTIIVVRSRASLRPMTTRFDAGSVEMT